MLEILYSKLLDLFLDSIWIGGIFWMFLWSTLKVINPRFARFKYYLSVSTFFGLFLVLLVVSFGADSLYNIWLKPKVLVFVKNISENRSFDFGITDSIKLFIIQYNYYLILLWFCGFIVFMIKLFFQFTVIRRVKESGIFDYGLNILKEDLVKRIGIKKEVYFKFIRNGSYPFTVGYFKPIVYFPIQAVTSFTAEELELILFHELIHIKRNDYVINLLQLFLEGIFFFNPFVQQISKLVKEERETSCDSYVIKEGYSKLIYAKALERSYQLHYDQALHFGDKNVFSRVNNLMWFRVSNKPIKKYQNLFSVFLVLSFVFLTLGFGVFTKNTFSSTKTVSNDIEVYPRIEFRYDTVVFKRNANEALYMLNDTLIAYAEDGIFKNEKLINFQRKEIDKIDHVSILIIDKVLGDTLQKGKEWKDNSEWKIFKQELEDRCLLPDELYTSFISPFNVFYINDNPVPEGLQNKYASLIKSHNPYSSENLVFIHKMISELQKDKLVDENFDSVEVVFSPKSNGELILNGEMLTKKYADKYFIYLKEIFETPLYENYKYFIK